VPGTLAAIDEAAEVLYSHSDFHKGAYDLYRVAIEGRATRAQEALIETLRSETLMGYAETAP
jgi:hypothetical protein